MVFTSHLISGSCNDLAYDVRGNDHHAIEVRNHKIARRDIHARAAGVGRNHRRVRVLRNGRPG